jgi:hypothetical protein
LSVLIEACLDAFALIITECGSLLEVDTETCAEFVLAGDSSVSGPVLVVPQEGTFELGCRDLSRANCLERVDVEV